MTDSGESTAEMVGADQGCIRCGYNLRGLSPAVVCPECGTPVSDSLRGIFLQYASSEYLATVHSGLRLVLYAILATIVMFVVGMFGGVAGLGPEFQLVLNGVGFLISIVSMVGYWRYTQVDPMFAGEEKPDAARRVVRGTVLVQAATTAVSFVVGLAGVGGAVSRASGTVAAAVTIGLMLGLLSLAAFVVQFFAVMRYTRWMARRVPDEHIVHRSGRYMWLLPVLAVLGAPLLLLGPLLALVMYWNLLDRLQRHLRAIRATGRPAALTRMEASPA